MVMKTAELRQMDLKQLNETLIERRREQFNLRMQRATQQLTKPHLFQQIKIDIARIKTIMREKQHEQKDN